MSNNNHGGPRPNSGRRKGSTNTKPAGGHVGFYLSGEFTTKLKTKLLPGESVGQAAKRLLTSMLNEAET